MRLKSVGRLANSVDLDQTPQAASDQVCTVRFCLSVQIRRVYTVNPNEVRNKLWLSYGFYFRLSVSCVNNKSDKQLYLFALQNTAVMHVSGTSIISF